MKNRTFNRREFRAPKWIAVLLALGLLFPLAGVFSLYPREGISLWTISMATLAVLFLIGLLDVLISRIIINEESLEVVSNFRRRQYPRAAFSSVTWAKGCSVKLILRNGGHVQIPYTVDGGLPMANTLRAWLKRA
jgi:hypothetical protein